jgi:glycosyltransferase involved in cell wall biosynthesis
VRIALVHDWLVSYRGGERVLAELCRLFPQADLFTLFYRPGSTVPIIEQRHIRKSWLGYLPKVERYYRWLLPLLPLAVRTLRVGGYDLVISSSHAVAKAAAISPKAVHVCYCHTPMRYVWHLRREYFPEIESSEASAATTPRHRHDVFKESQAGGFHRSAVKMPRWLFRLREHVLDLLQDWDRRTAERVDYFLANSRTVQQRIRECYGRESQVIYPPVDTDFFRPASVSRREYYLVVSALVPYKRVDLAVQACTHLGRHLLVIGSGSEERRLRELAGPTVHFAGWLPDSLVREHLQRCRALIFPGEEDFGIVPVEAQACGTPVIALGKGGATETVIPPEHSSRPTGLWFHQASVESLADAILRFERESQLFRPEVCRQNALRFDRTHFRREIVAFLRQVLPDLPLAAWESDRQAA